MVIGVMPETFSFRAVTRGMETDTARGRPRWWYSPRADARAAG